MTAPGVRQSGSVTPNHLVLWTTEGVIKDGGSWPPSPPPVSTSIVTQALIDASPDGSIITVGAGGTINAITIGFKALHFILLPGAPIMVTGTITMESNVATTWTGYGSGPGFGSRLQWQGNSTDFMFTISRCQYCQFNSFGVSSDPSNHPLNVAFATMSTTTGQVPTQCYWQDIYIDGTNTGGLQYCFRIAVAGDANGNNNDFHTFTNVTCNNYNIAAWSIEMPEAKGQKFLNCGASGNGFGHYGIWQQSGSFIADGFNGGGHIFADFELDQADDFISISNIDLEDSNRVLNTGQSSNPQPLIISGGRIATNGLNADGKVMIFSQRGPFIVMNVTIDNSNNLNVQLSLDASGRCQGIAIGCNITSNLANPFTTTNVANGRWLTLGDNVAVGTGGTLSNPIPFPSIGPVLTFAELPSASVGARGEICTITDCVSPIVGDVAVGGGTFEAVVQVDVSVPNYKVVNSFLPFGSAPSTQTGNYSQAVSDTSLIFNGSGTITLTLLSAATYPGRKLWVKTIAAFTVVSASSNVCPIDSATPGTAILPGTAGAWALLQSNGTNWITMQRGT
jgi:hypothetical protein